MKISDIASKRKGKRGRVDGESIDSRHQKHHIKQKKETLREHECEIDDETGIDYHKFIR
jgi:hypothetical protein